MTDPIVILSGARTAIGSFGGALKDIPPAELGTIVIKAAIERAGLTPADIEHTVLGQVIHTIPQDAFIARVAAVNAGIPVSSPALTVNRLCASGVQAIINAAHLIAVGDADIAVAAAAESMSRSPYLVASARFGQKMGDAAMVDALVTTLTDPFGNGHMGITAENVAAQCGIGRADQDALALQSHQRAAAAIADGRFKEQITPVPVKTRKGVVDFDTDEGVRGETTIEGLAGLRPVFKKDGSVTAGNSSTINDGAAALVLARESVALERGLKPRARILSWGYAGVEPSVMGLGPVKAVPAALKKAGLTLDQIDVIESNEAFAAQACAVAGELKFDPAKTNINGSGISLGHPIGATGAILTVKALYELERTEKRYGLITLCIGGGQGIALVIERVA